MVVELFDPNNDKYVLYSKGSLGTKLDSLWPTVSQPVQGNLFAWVGKNPKGKWRLIVYDHKFKDNTTDGKIASWSVKTTSISNKMVCLNK